MIYTAVKRIITNKRIMRMWPLAKHSFYFEILTWSPTSNFESLSSFPSSKSNNAPVVTSIGFILIVLRYTLYSVNMSSKLKLEICRFYSFKVLINLSATADFPSLCVEYISILFSCKHVSLIYCKIHYLYLLIFFLVYILWT